MIFFVVELNPKQSFFLPLKQVSIDVRHVGTLVILHINRLIFQPAVKQSKGATLGAECLCTF